VLTPRAPKPELAGQQYAVVLVDEDQLNQLMHRPAMRQVNSRFASNDALVRYERLKRRTAAAAVVLLVLAAGGAAWVFVPQPAMASMFDWSKPAAIPTLYTGASFSVTLASLDSADGANDAAARVRALGMPAFTRRSPGKNQVYQAMVGPFASLDEAEKAQRRLGGMGYPGARLFVDVSQSLGVLRFDATDAGADYVGAHGYKWLLAPRGASWLWVRSERVPELRPLAPSWKSVESPFADFYGGPIEPLLASSARRLDASLAWFSWVGARAALSLVTSLDGEAVERRCLGLAATFRNAAAERGLVPAPVEIPSQTVALTVPDPEALRARLSERGIVAAVRGSSLRLGFHAFNDETDVAAALAALDGAA